MGIDELIFSNAKKYPDKVAYESDELKVSYKQLESFSSSFARFYLSNQVEPLEVIALSIRNDFIYLIAMLGAIKIGATLFSIPVTESVESRIKELTQLKITKYFSDSRNDGEFEWIKTPVNLTSKNTCQFNFPSSNKIDMPWMALTSSGSTGARKIFFLTHRQQLIRSEISNKINQLDGEDRVSTMSPLCYPTTKQRYLEALLMGATIIKLRGFNTANFLADYRVTVLFSTSMHAENLLKEINENNPNLAKLRRIFIGGSEVRNSLRERIASALGNVLVVRYSCNETSLICSTNRDNLAASLSVGTPVDGVQVKIINDAGIECDIGTDGLILVKTPGMITCYLNEEDTRKNFRDGWFITGDMGNLSSQGVLTHKGRRDGVVIFNGINISLSEITKTALDLDFVVDAASISLSHPIHQDIPVCVVQLKDSSSSKLEYLKIYLRKKLGSRGPKAAYEVNAIPRNVNGKLVLADMRNLLEKIIK